MCSVYSSIVPVAKKIATCTNKIVRVVFCCLFFLNIILCGLFIAMEIKCVVIILLAVLAINGVKSAAIKRNIGNC